MKLYRLKHIPTGLYFTPSKCCGNLTKKGKIYVNLVPQITNWTSQIRIKVFALKSSGKAKILCDFLGITNKDTDNGRYISIDKIVSTKESDWEIEEILN